MAQHAFDLRCATRGERFDHAFSSAGRAGLPQGLDGLAVRHLLRGAVRQGADPQAILQKASIDPAIYGNEDEVIDGRALVGLMRQIQFALDDVYLGFIPHGCRMALETERLLSFLRCTTFGEALRVSIRFTNAVSSDVGPGIREEHGSGLQHICQYHTVAGVDRATLVWIRFAWIYHFFSWLIGRPLALRGLSIRGPQPVQANGFDRFALFGCPVAFNAPFDALTYDWQDLTAPLRHTSIEECDAYYASEPDWFAEPSSGQSWRAKTQQVLIEFQRGGIWSAPVEMVAARLRTRPRRLRHDLSREGESFQEIRTRLRGELATAYLLASDLPITEIGFVLGFSEPASFTRQFCTWAGTTPSSYRERHKGNAGLVAAATALLVERRAQ